MFILYQSLYPINWECKKKQPDSLLLLETKNLIDFYKKLESILELEIVENNNNKTIN